MHKYFAKPLFLGKKVEFLTECHSTNQELQLRQKKDDIKEGYIIYTDHQISGKGQRGNAWVSDPGKNLLFSLFLTPRFLKPGEAYLLNLVAGLAMIRLLKSLINDGTLELKWPNDVYVDDCKICGILVETTIEGNDLEGAIVGIGLNVNQRSFDLPNVTSLILETNRTSEISELLEIFLINFEYYYLKLKSGKKRNIIQAYYEVMRWRGEIHHFRSHDTEFEGEILGIDEAGRLQVRVEQEVRKFDTKEIQFLI